ncbi:hypothetical protein [Lentzea sp.]|uniref:hypothetical protein n=1 Tax=Lentzea sp. TaxID=56099 RepID=UPI002D09D04E|nr:hypothetical protein [Lentzea sp.]HUQ57771.1 hypothetical protein [Lentzea sp.]
MSVHTEQFLAQRAPTVLLPEQAALPQFRREEVGNVVEGVRPARSITTRDS